MRIRRQDGSVFVLKPERGTRSLHSSEFAPDLEAKPTTAIQAEVDSLRELMVSGRGPVNSFSVKSSEIGVIAEPRHCGVPGYRCVRLDGLVPRHVTDELVAGMHDARTEHLIGLA